MEMLPENPVNHCSVLVRNNTSHMARLPTGLIAILKHLLALLEL